MRIFYYIAAIALLFSCKSEDTSSMDEEVFVPIKVPKFDSDLAYQNIEKQLSFGTRVPGSEAHAECKEWIVQTMKSYGWKVEQQRFRDTVYTDEVLPGTNIIAKYNPSAHTRILLAAHYDTRHIAEKETENVSRKDEPIMGADDGASGVAVLMSMAKLIGESPLAIGVDMVFFDLEDYGEPHADNPDSWALGSAYWARNKSDSYNPKHAILLDMVGSKDASFGYEAWSAAFNLDLLQKTWNLAQNMGYGKYFKSEVSGSLTDDHVSVIKHAEIPMINIVNMTGAGLGHYHHTHSDDIDIIDKRTLKAVGQVVTAVVFNTQNGNF